ncbi:hypothetical protein BDN72DRAFT_270773 [Pluteus cervinus]|uniref:Uncharacterized protein n=1 Tax=Pluteus cervinus TaxID=181527 RepID=A0ACD3B5N0_9AGAR|nr:hypothetical protein BDN72DRAFT_270773 [Pluteus cervinus]
MFIFGGAEGNIYLFYAISCASVLFFVGLVHPITNVIVRFRADYTPRRVQLAVESGEEASVGNMGVQSVFGLIKRIYTIEGIKGFFKGYVPTAAVSLIGFLFAAFFLGIDSVQPAPRQDSWPEISPLANLIICFTLTFLGLPLTVITYRAITTPYNLPWFNISKGYLTLLSPTEARKPWLLWFTPGLFAASFARNILYLFGLVPLHRLLLPGGPEAERRAEHVSLFILAVLITTAISTPLEVMETRVAIQRNHSGPIVAQTIDVPNSGSEEVIGYRSEDDTFKSLLDTGDRISREEGWYILYRAWWFTLIGGLSFLAI